MGSGEAGTLPPGDSTTLLGRNYNHGDGGGNGEDHDE